MCTCCTCSSHDTLCSPLQAPRRWMISQTIPNLGAGGGGGLESLEQKPVRFPQGRRVEIFVSALVLSRSPKWRSGLASFQPEVV